MAELEYGNRDNLFNAMKAKAPDGSLLDLTLNFTENNPIIRDLPTYPANNGMSHTGFRWVTMPTGEVVSIGGGWNSSYAQGQNFEEGMMIVRSRYQIPRDVLQHMGANAATYRRAQEGAHMESNIQGWANTLMYGTAVTTPTKIDGLSYRPPWNAVTADFCYSMGGSGHRRSVWLINPGLTKVHLIHNKDNPTLGVKREPMPIVKEPVYAIDGTTLLGHRWDEVTEFEFEHGLCIVDTKACKRICDIDYTAIPSPTLINKIIELRLIHEDMVQGQWFLYCDPRIFIHLIQLAQSEQNVQYSSDNPYRVRLPMIGDIIVRRMAALNTDESSVA